MTTNITENIIKSSLSNSKTIIAGAHGLSVAQIMVMISAHKPVIFVAASPELAENYLRDFRFLIGNLHKEQILHLPAQDKTPYHVTSPEPNVVMERLSTLNKIATETPFQILITSPEALNLKTLSLENLQQSTEIVELKGQVDREILLKRIEAFGYNKVNLVEDPGTYACRGSIIDIFWPGFSLPVRIDLFGNQVERLTSFKPETQHTIENLSSFQFGPVKEISLTRDVKNSAADKLRDLADELNYPTKKLLDKLNDLNNGIPFFGIESLLPAFFDNLESPLELIDRVYAKNHFVIALNDQNLFEQSISAQTKEYKEHYDSALLRNELSFTPEHFLIGADKIQSHLHNQLLLDFNNFSTQNQINHQNTFHLNTEVTDVIRQDILRETTRTDTEEASPHHLLAPLAHKIRELYQDHYQIFLPTASLGGTHRLTELLKYYGLNVRSLKSPPELFNKAEGLNPKDRSIHAYTYVAIPDSPAHGAIFKELRTAIFCEDDIFGKHARRKGKTGKKGGFRTSLADLEENDPIVHVDHGIGLFRGLVRLNVNGVEQDYLHLTYKNNDKLYLPVHRINLVQTYSGASTNPQLDKLGGSTWQTKKTQVKKAVLAMAQDLLNLYAQRELAQRPHFAAPDASYWEFEGRFPFETTPDQQKAIDDVLGDLQKKRPMDRLVCGDVGYGKTEVAMRAAMLAVMNKGQVAVLAPTTVLAQQHGITFAERFKETGARVEVISRFQKPAEIKQIIQKTKEGKVDILIGTHRILSSDVHFKQLGLVIVDEEQRFGIKHKEHLKKLRCHVDILTLSATPIPRTLEMGFFGIRDLSIIETPPVDRRAIRTSITRFDDEVIREAILLELKRQGQVYFVHNKVSSINATADYIKRLVPEAKIEVGHGQMDADELEKVMVRFMTREFNVLVCTTIIETGIDVATANTMFIDNADDFGLAQLYQLRGRIGRSKERAFAYLLIPSDVDQLTTIARKRLEILHRFSELGAGFRIAQHDLELRGAGDLLGKSQHGHVAAVGYDLYSDLLKDAVAALKGKAQETAFDPDIKIPVSAFIPEKYIADLHDRMGYYQKLVTAANSEEVWNIVGQMNDQCGENPPEVNALAEVMILKQMLKELSIHAVDFAKIDEKQKLPRIIFTLGNNSILNLTKLNNWVKNNSQKIIMTEKMKLIYSASLEEWQTTCNQDIFLMIKHVINKIKVQAI